MQTSAVGKAMKNSKLAEHALANPFPWSILEEGSLMTAAAKEIPSFFCALLLPGGRG